MLPAGNPTPPTSRRNRARRGLALVAFTALGVLTTIGGIVPAAATPANAVTTTTTAATDTGPGTAVTTEDVSFRSGELTLHGTVISPAEPTPAADRPGLVMVHGSGRGSRESYRTEAEAFARAGIATLIYDKRPGYSKLNRDYSALADDALAAVAALRSQHGVNPARVGLWGLSEGGWVAPLAASRSTDVAFVVTVGANGGPPAQQQAWNYDNRLAEAGVRGSLPSTVRTGVRVSAGVGLFPEAYYDPVPALERVRQPVLGLWGARDKLTPAAESMRIFQDTFDRIGNTHYTLRVIPDAEHTMHRSPDGYTKLDEFGPGYLDLVGSWVNQLDAGPPHASVDPAPHQDRLTVPITALRWYESAWLQVAALVGLLMVFLSYPVTALVRRLAGRRTVPLAARPARWLAATGLATVLGFLGYVGYLVLGGGQALGPVVLGRPIPWLVLQLLSVGVLVATAATVLAWRRQHHHVAGQRLRLGLLTAGGVALLPWALYWGLLLP
ncbi:alpha/beta hydrolase family protein [Goodfellowiella coeruleoviolacea]|uniref:Alpha/beta hydrolase n=1 Tax=Goodfellowiella coeruleoviolacea TaxID=334858 RepID=A0AAE3GEJ2_9PSEU|nr:alpha/beta fold hydrolase [Goodfellowiella coeruleoviolacea]MCP2166690.1 hypothetical protein [Goodfellowiella coeruleoviolacea]